jgi:hypothetical protein
MPLVPLVIARSGSDEAIQLQTQSWIASRALTMTRVRNDGDRFIGGTARRDLEAAPVGSW